jgi:hypothetical protein
MSRPEPSAEQQPPPEFMTALTTEHYMLQGTASATTSEGGSRISVYLSALSSGLVAIGFASSSHRALEALAFTVLPVVFILGWFTIVRLIDISVTNLVSQRRMDLITRYYASIWPPASAYFGPGGQPGGQPGRRHGVHYGSWAFLFTMASMVIVVNSVVGGAAVALVAALALRAAAPAPVVAGLIGGVILLVAGLYYEHRRLTPVVLSGLTFPGPIASGPTGGDDL